MVLKVVLWNLFLSGGMFARRSRRDTTKRAFQHWFDNDVDVIMTQETHSWWAGPMSYFCYRVLSYFKLLVHLPGVVRLLDYLMVIESLFMPRCFCFVFNNVERLEREAHSVGYIHTLHSPMPGPHFLNHGLLILSRHPITPGIVCGLKGKQEGKEWSYDFPGDSIHLPGMLVATMHHPVRGDICLATLHNCPTLTNTELSYRACNMFNYFRGLEPVQLRKQALSRVCEVLSEVSKTFPVIVAGDFNMPSGTQEFDHFIRRLRDEVGLLHLAMEGESSEWTTSTEDDEDIDHFFVSKQLALLSPSSGSATGGGSTTGEGTKGGRKQPQSTVEMDGKELRQVKRIIDFSRGLGPEPLGSDHYALYAELL